MRGQGDLRRALKDPRNKVPKLRLQGPQENQTTRSQKTEGALSHFEKAKPRGFPNRLPFMERRHLDASIAHDKIG